MRVFLLEDDPGNLLTLSTLLEEEGFEVVTASSLAQAGAILDGGKFECAILDKTVGDGDGLSLIPRLRGLETRVVVLTGDRGGVPAGLDVDGVFAKGEDVSILVNMLSLLAGK